MFVQELTKFGLTEKEAKVYLATLGIGETLASTISQKTSIHRATTYCIVSRLIKKGLMNIIIRNGVHFFYAIEPGQILKNARQNLSQEQQKIQRLEMILPDLNLMLKKTRINRPRIQHFEGFDHIPGLYRDIITSRGRLICSFVSLKTLTTRFLNFFNEKIKDGQQQHNIAHRILLPENEKNFSKKLRSDLTRTRIISLQKFSFNPLIHIYENKVIFIEENPTPSGILIENSAICQTMQGIFDTYWEQGTEV